MSDASQERGLGSILVIIPTYNEAQNIESITFYLLNGWFADDGLNTCYGGSEGPGRLEVLLDGWQLRIEPRGDVSSRTMRDHLRRTSASTVTHIGRLRRDDGKPFKAADALGFEVVPGLVELEWRSLT